MKTTEQAIRDKILYIGDEIPAGFIGASMIAQTIKDAEVSIEENDVVKMLRSYKKLQEIEG